MTRHWPRWLPELMWRYLTTARPFAFNFHRCRSKVCRNHCASMSFDAEMVDEILQRLTVLRAQMLPSPLKN